MKRLTIGFVLGYLAAVFSGAGGAWLAAYGPRYGLSAPGDDRND